MARFPSIRGEIPPFVYPLLAVPLLLVPHGYVALVFRLSGWNVEPDAGFWLLPLRRLAEMPFLTALQAALGFALALLAAWALAVLSFRRATRARRGYALAALTIVPVLQLLAVAALTFMPALAPEPEQEGEPARGAEAGHVLQGLVAGVAIIVFAVLVSAVSFGAYGWGLFVLTPFTVGLTTAYIANRSVEIGFGRTMLLALGAGALGGFALILFALEGLMCILLIAPLAALMICAGAVIGGALAGAGHRRGRPLLTVALLPAAFALEAAMPPSVTIDTREAIDVAAPPQAVWAALTDDAPIAAPPGLVGQAGLAYPVRGRLVGEGVGAGRLGEFSTGIAHERITLWEPGRTLAFAVLDQPAAMEEMSPYRRVHAPHLNGYFDTSATRFDLAPLPGGGTRLTIRAAHVLRIDPTLYWAPIARWAVRENTRRVLRDVADKAERMHHTLESSRRKPGSMTTVGT